MPRVPRIRVANPAGSPEALRTVSTPHTWGVRQIHTSKGPT
jgi:hypothetical protein